MIKQDTATPSSGTTDCADTVLLLGAPFNQNRYALASGSVLAVVCILLLCLNYY
jgi:hypothetical protein